MTIYLTDPNRQTKFSIETSSQHGSQIVGKPGHILYYEVNLLVDDLSDPAQNDECDSNNAFAACIDDKLQKLFLEVIYLLLDRIILWAVDYRRCLDILEFL